MNIFNILKFLGGLALFLYGMNYMGDELKKAGGSKFETLLRKMTDKKIKGLLFGAVITAIVQSSSAITVMTVGLVNSKLLSLHQAVGIIMGANIGTTITSWILSLTGIQSSNLFISMLKPSVFSPVIAFVGIILFLSGKTEKKKHIGSIMLGFGTLMFGMESMSSAVEPLKNSPEFTSILTLFQNPILGILAGAFLTAVIQSSSASVGILQALSTTGSITVLSAFPLILGQNIGTCITAIISSINTSKNAKRVSVVHLLFNVIGVVFAAAVFYLINGLFDLNFVNEKINSATIAAIHTAFNIFSTIILFPFGRQIEKLSYLFVPDKEKIKN